MKAYTLLPVLAVVASAQNMPPPAPVLLNATKSGVLPVLPPMFTGVLTLEGAIIKKAPVNSSYVPVNGPAAVQSGMPKATYVATLPVVAFDSLTGTTVSGSVIAVNAENGTGVTFTVNFSNLPNATQYGPFGYHIHNLPVPANGDCIATEGHFDYTNAGEYYTCDTNNTKNCQTGDLAGKHGSIANGTSYSKSYNDPYLSTNPSSPYFFGNLSLVFHTGNRTRLSCANFKMAAASGPSGSATASGPMSTYTGAAAPRSLAGGLVVGAAAMFAWVL